MSVRTERVAGVVRETVTDVLARGALKDPRVLAGGLITVTHVRVSADLGVAWVFVTTVGGGAVDETVKGLRSAAGYVRAELGRRLRARRVPEIRFEVDTAGEREERVEAALREIAEERTRRGGGEGGEAPAAEEAAAAPGGAAGPGVSAAPEEPGEEPAEPADADAPGEPE